MAVLGPEELDARLAVALDALGSGPRDVPARQRTLRATLEWSHRLLSAPEAEAFARFAVFAGGATVETAEEVTGADVDALEALVEKNLLLRDSGRLMMLETVRAYARSCSSARIAVQRCGFAIAGTSSRSPRLRSRTSAPMPKRSGCGGSTRRPTTSGRHWPGLSMKAGRDWPYVWPVGSGILGVPGCFRGRRSLAEGGDRSSG